MKILFSPSKTMKVKEITFDNYQSPIFSEKTKYIIEKLHSLNIEEIARIYKIKGKILEETFNNIKNFFNQEEYSSISLYEGVSFRQLNIKEYTDSNKKYTLENLLIFSALYGILYPNTLMRNYRLDMTINILNESMYKFWNNDINEYLEKNYSNEIFLNLASKEFSKIIDYKKFKVVDVEFRQIVDGKEKNISTEAKKARGKLLNYIILNEIEDIEKIKEFSEDDYIFSKEKSTENTLFFIKDKI